MTDFRLMALETVNDEAVLLRERIASLEGDVEIYRQLLSDALDQLHVALDRDDRQRDLIARLTNDNRQLRDAMILETV